MRELVILSAASLRAESKDLARLLFAALICRGFSRKDHHGREKGGCEIFR
jgi:hypothetical protein